MERIDLPGPELVVERIRSSDTLRQARALLPAMQGHELLTLAHDALRAIERFDGDEFQHPRATERCVRRSVRKIEKLLR